eukprot:365391-Chlamydomonas_euryale.AAC.12
MPATQPPDVPPQTARAPASAGRRPCKDDRCILEIQWCTRQRLGRARAMTSARKQGQWSASGTIAILAVGLARAAADLLTSPYDYNATSSCSMQLQTDRKGACETFSDHGVLAWGSTTHTSFSLISCGGIPGKAMDEEFRMPGVPPVAICRPRLVARSARPPSSTIGQWYESPTSTLWCHLWGRRLSLHRATAT